MWEFVEGEVQPGETWGFSQEVAHCLMEVTQVNDAVVTETEGAAKIFTFWIFF